MGYADITTTMNIYAEATKEKKQQAMANLNGKISLTIIRLRMPWCWQT